MANVHWQSTWRKLPLGITQENKLTKGSKEQDVKHEEQESVGSPKLVVELTSDTASADAELSAVMQHLRQVEQRELCQGLSAQADGSDALGSSSSSTAGLRELWKSLLPHFILFHHHVSTAWVGGKNKVT